MHVLQHPRVVGASRVLAPPIALLVTGLIAGTNLYWTYVITAGLIAFILTTGFNLTAGYTGIFNLSIVALYGIGGFTSVYVEEFWHWSFWVSLPFSIVVTTVISILIALPSRGLSEMFLAIETLAVALALAEVTQQWMSFTGGSGGVSWVQVPSFFGIELVGGTLPYLWFCSICALLTFLLARQIHRSPVGRKLVGLREGPRVVAAVGLSRGSVALVAFGLSGALAGLAGVLYSRFQLFISPQAFGFDRLTQLLIAAILGGFGMLYGPLIGVAVILVMDEVALSSGQSHDLVYGVAIIVLIILGSGGVAGQLSRLGQHSRRLLGRRFPPRAGDTALTVGADTTVDAAWAAVAGTPLVVQNISVAFGGTRAVEQAGLELRRGEVVGLIGPNGAGKTSLLNAITGDVRPSEGSVQVDGHELVGMKQNAIVRHGVARTFQSPQIIPELSLVANLMLASDGQMKQGWLRQIIYLPSVRQADREARARGLDLLQEFGLRERADEPASDQTYGVLRLVEIARNLMLHPRFLLLDEPGAGLTETERVEVADYLQKLRGRGIGVLLVDHNMTLIRACCERLYVMDNGWMIAEGDTDTVLSREDVVSAYLGKGVDDAAVH